jgi:hypothetical protein
MCLTHSDRLKFGHTLKGLSLLLIIVKTKLSRQRVATLKYSNIFGFV